MRGNCPFCPERAGKEDAKRSLGMNATTGYFACFRCGMRGRVAEITLDFDTSEVVERPRTIEPPEAFTSLVEGPGATAESLASARAYLRGRGLDEALWAAVGLGACATGRYAGRVVVPIFDETGETWCGWVSRAWYKKATVPYLYPEGMDRATVLYNSAALQIETDEPAVIVEGVMDAICPAVFPHGVALLGKHSPAQLDQLHEARRPLAIVLDGDAHEEGEMLALRLRFDGMRAFSVKLPAGRDPDEMGSEWLHAQLREGQKLVT